jgi:putative restriction endonuclease
MMGSMPTRVPWSRDELLVAFRLYCRTPFGRLHQHNPEIIELGRTLGRTPSAVGMKACNFASLDPALRARDIGGLSKVSRSDRVLWDEFGANPEAVAAQAEAAYARLTGREAPPVATELGLPDGELELPDGPTEVTRAVRTRRVQAFFRAAVLAGYEYRCALSDIAAPELLNASHIIPWNADPHRRADPRNGLALNALYDRAFDRGLITFDESLRLVISPRLRAADPPAAQRQAFHDMEGKPLRLPSRFAPDPAALAYHRERVFVER